MILKKTKKQSFTLFRQYIFWNIFLGLRRRFFLNETSILAFAELAIFHSYLNKSVGKIVTEITK